MFTVAPEFYNQIAAAVLLAMKSELMTSESSKVANDATILFNVEDVAGKLKVCEKTVIAKIKTGLLKAANIGTLDKPNYRVSKADLQAFYHANRIK